MKKKLVILAIALIAVCLTVVAYDRVVPAAAVHAACAQSYQVANPIPSPQEARTAQPVVLVGAGLVSVLLGVLAISPLLVGEPGSSGKEW